MNTKQLNEAFLDACHEGNLDKVKFLLNSPELNNNANIHYQEDSGIHQACENGHLHILQYLLTSPELKEHADIHSKNDWVLTIACNEGFLDIVKYLLTSPDLKEHSNFKAEQLDYAIHLENMDIVDYLLNSSDLKEKYNVHIDNDKIFKNSCEFADKKMLHYLIYELNIDRTDEINNYLAEPNGRPNNLKSEAKNMFEMRDLKKDLNKELPDNNESTKKLKL